MNWTDRRREVRELVLQGLDFRQIASLLGMSPYTARTHVSNVLLAAGARSMRELQAREIARLRKMVGEAA